MLYIVSTPIGNLKDISLRALDTLKECALILCEDTRHTQKLLNNYQIKAKTKSYHKFNEAEVESEYISLLKNGIDIALVSDAGTPCISDPGQRLVKKCQEENILVSSIPGPCAVITALSLFGFPSIPFQFLGFLPKKNDALKTLLIPTLSYQGTSLAYESPKRLVNTLTLFESLSPYRTLGVARELTKSYEEVRLGTPKELVDHYKQKPPKGEIVLGISPVKPEEIFSSLSPQEHVQQLINEYNLPKKEAIKIAAHLRHSQKKELYKLFIEESDNC